uniref:Uncharacterized protein n=1 Tax=Hyaloperonospora arabidopsidis (strain Emoy2) TaxID=559515 RepID=M4C497_HYAAE
MSSVVLKAAVFHVSESFLVVVNYGVGGGDRTARTIVNTRTYASERVRSEDNCLRNDIAYKLDLVMSRRPESSTDSATSVWMRRQREAFKRRYSKIVTQRDAVSPDWSTAGNLFSTSVKVFKSASVLAREIDDRMDESRTGSGDSSKVAISREISSSGPCMRSSRLEMRRQTSDVAS